MLSTFIHFYPLSSTFIQGVGCGLFQITIEYFWMLKPLSWWDGNDCLLITVITVNSLHSLKKTGHNKPGLEETAKMSWNKNTKTKPAKKLRYKYVKCENIIYKQNGALTTREHRPQWNRIGWRWILAFHHTLTSTQRIQPSLMMIYMKSKYISALYQKSSPHISTIPPNYLLNRIDQSGPLGPEMHFFGHK